MADVVTQNADELGRAQNLLTGILEHMKIAASVKANEDDERIVLEIECGDDEDVQRIIGRRGQVVDALQHVVSKMMVKDRGERGKILVVDAGGYRQRHIERLEGLAQRMADKCKETGESVELSPMPAHDRRIVHMAIAKIDGVATESEGEGDLRHIVINPA
jgi:spoIIIJ-associated protein